MIKSLSTGGFDPHTNDQPQMTVRFAKLPTQKKPRRKRRTRIRRSKSQPQTRDHPGEGMGKTSPKSRDCIKATSSCCAHGTEELGTLQNTPRQLVGAFSPLYVPAALSVLGEFTCKAKVAAEQIEPIVAKNRVDKVDEFPHLPNTPMGKEHRVKARKALHANCEKVTPHSVSTGCIVTDVAHAPVKGKQRPKSAAEILDGKRKRQKRLSRKSRSRKKLEGTSRDTPKKDKSVGSVGVELRALEKSRTVISSSKMTDLTLKQDPSLAKTMLKLHQKRSGLRIIGPVIVPVGTLSVTSYPQLPEVRALSRNNSKPDYSDVTQTELSPLALSSAPHPKRKWRRKRRKSKPGQKMSISEVVTASSALKSLSPTDISANFVAKLHRRAASFASACSGLIGGRSPNKTSISTAQGPRPQVKSKDAITEVPTSSAAHASSSRPRIRGGKSRSQSGEAPRKGRQRSAEPRPSGFNYDHTGWVTQGNPWSSQAKNLESSGFFEEITAEPEVEMRHHWSLANSLAEDIEAVKIENKVRKEKKKKTTVVKKKITRHPVGLHGGRASSRRQARDVIKDKNRSVAAAAELNTPSQQSPQLSPKSLLSRTESSVDAPLRGLDKQSTRVMLEEFREKMKKVKGKKTILPSNVPIVSYNSPESRRQPRLRNMPQTYQQLGLAPLMRSPSAENCFPKIASILRDDKKPQDKKPTPLKKSPKRAGKSSRHAAAAAAGGGGAGSKNKRSHPRERRGGGSSGSRSVDREKPKVVYKSMVRSHLPLLERKAVVIVPVPGGQLPLHRVVRHRSAI